MVFDVSILTSILSFILAVDLSAVLTKYFLFNHSKVASFFLGFFISTASYIISNLFLFFLAGIIAPFFGFERSVEELSFIVLGGIGLLLTFVVVFIVSLSFVLSVTHTSTKTA